jgi:hypothetical protein
VQRNDSQKAAIKSKFMSAGPFVSVLAPFPKALELPPPGPHGMCGNKGEACCADQTCNEGMACNVYDIYTDRPDYYPDWFTCQECGGLNLDHDAPFRVGQLACDGKH